VIGIIVLGLVGFAAQTKDIVFYPARLNIKISLFGLTGYLMGDNLTLVVA
jgi:hypothetical protein